MPHAGYILLKLLRIYWKHTNKGKYFPNTAQRLCSYLNPRGTPGGIQNHKLSTPTSAQPPSPAGHMPPHVMCQSPRADNQPPCCRPRSQSRLRQAAQFSCQQISQAIFTGHYPPQRNAGEPPGGDTATQTTFRVLRVLRVVPRWPPPPKIDAQIIRVLATTFF